MFGPLPRLHLITLVTVSVAVFLGVGLWVGQLTVVPFTLPVGAALGRARRHRGGVGPGPRLPPPLGTARPRRTPLTDARADAPEHMTDAGRASGARPAPVPAVGQTLTELSTARTSAGDCAWRSCSTWAESTKISAIFASSPRWSLPAPAMPMTNSAGLPFQST